MRIKNALKTRVLFVLLAFVAMTVSGLLISKPSSAAGTPQASITLTNCDEKFCYTHQNNWTLTKEVTNTNVVNGVGTVTWTIAATNSSGATSFTVHGTLTVTNTGTAPATIGNIVVNLQKPNSPKKGG